MKVKWHKLLLKLTIWSILEIMLTFLGLDDIADYGEFIFSNDRLITLSNIYGTTEVS